MTSSNSNTDEPTFEPDFAIDPDEVATRSDKIAAFESMRRMRLTSASGVVPSLFMCIATANSLALRPRIVWWLILFAVDGAAFVHANLFLRKPPDSTNAQSWLRRQTAFQTLAGVIWGFPTIWFVNKPPATQLLGAVVLVAVYAVASIGLLHHREAVLGWTMGAWCIPIIAVSTAPSATNRLLLIGIVVLLVSMNLYIWEATNQHKQGIVRRVESELLAEALTRAGKRIEKLAKYDDLTECLSRRFGMQELRTAWSEATHGPPSILLIDIDHFKRINDEYGHPGGDSVLRAVSRLLRSNISRADQVARIGGEEFLVVMRNTNDAEASRVADRLRSVVERTAMLFDNQRVYITISIGWAVGHLDESPERCIARADRALYIAKNSGRNRVISAEYDRRDTLATPVANDIQEAFAGLDTD